jgi:hypothetical protein
MRGIGHDTRRIDYWLGHRSIRHTTRYTQLSASPFKVFWSDDRGLKKLGVERSAKGRGHQPSTRYANL